MVSNFDRIVITVPGLAQACTQYRQLLGADPSGTLAGGVHREWFLLPNTVIELVESALERPVISAIVLGDADMGDVDSPVANGRGLDVRRCNGMHTAAERKRREPLQSEDIRVDHLVLRTADAADCIGLFGGGLGMRLALDKTVPEWGGRMLFFRTGKLTLEIIESEREKPETDYFWGIAYQCSDIDHTARILSRRGVILSEIRAGRKPGSRVATIKSHCLDIPTLLLQAG